MNEETNLQKLERLLNVLDHSDLMVVNSMVVQRLKLMDELLQLAARSQMQAGQRVTWTDRDGMLRQGRILRVNAKTVTVQEDGDPQGYWKVSASLLKIL